MSFFDFGTVQTTFSHGFDRRKDDRAELTGKLKAKLKELRAAGLDVEFEDDGEVDEPAAKPKADDKGCHLAC